MNYNSSLKCLMFELRKSGLLIDFEMEDYYRQLCIDYKSIINEVSDEKIANLCLFSITSYRLSNYLLKKDRNHSLISARQVSEYCKLITGVEIHPNANIGRGVVFHPHGGTVIGETSVIGSYSVIHEGAILGSKWVGAHHQKGGRRHPKIGTGSIIGSYAQVIGAVDLPPKYKLRPYGRVIEKSKGK
ncbi:serine O-acetyltransferase [Endozoicomonas acroporae]|uniref:serine O-acetyltransferase n=1 Tax=Endozoicomonas acroporae TaxID=1701104 RepID=UPI0013D4D05F|nr:hypothetical protein [Endozoicomonas acroporae]